MMYTFIGKDGSMGLENGKRYDVLITIEAGQIYAHIQLKTDRATVCLYDSMKLFLENWKPNDILNIDLGNTRGIKRPLDNLGRVVIPKEFRKELNFNKDDELQVFLLDDGIYITKK